MKIQICVGSSCHLKGSGELIALFEAAIARHSLESVVTLQGCFCIGKCNREGVSVLVDGNVYVGIRPQNFIDFFEKHVLHPLQQERKQAHG
ncbi:MAG: (2Fe-2S) ferredoxin domain-containing protein [Eubacteriales bacterium]|nr:(2Fe-2S) ferredoxin domain-containing protein [Eubacteriales bacterium]